MRSSSFAFAFFVVALIAAACTGGSGGSKTATPGTSTSNTPLSGGSTQATPSSAPAISSDIGLSAVDIVKKLAPSVVRVQTESASIDTFGNPTPSSGVGTGVIIDTAGHIVTNNHVVTTGTGDTPAQNITVTLSDQRTAVARIVGRDQPTDLAVIQIDQSDLSPANFGSSGELQVGQEVLAIGYALDLQGAPSVTKGVVSALRRTIQEQPYTIPDAIQTDAGINPGNSGGPLVDANADVVGINAAIIQGAQSIGFSISSAVVQPTVQALIANGKIDRAYLGVGTVDVTDAIAKNFGLPVNNGVAVTAVGSGSPAAQAGLRTNDVIVNVDGQDVANSGDLLAILAKHKAGDTVSVTYYRGASKQTTDVTLASRPNV